MHRKLIGALCASLIVVSLGCAKKAVVKLDSPKARPAVTPRYTPEQEAELKAILADAVLHFDYDDAVLKDEHKEPLERVAAALRVRPWVVVRIEGHCDERGTEEYNLALGQRRAESARQYLLALGVDPKAVEAVSFGDLRPVVEGHDEEAWVWNRRDEVVPARSELEEALAYQ